MEKRLRELGRRTTALEAQAFRFQSQLLQRQASLGNDAGRGRRGQAVNQVADYSAEALELAHFAAEAIQAAVRGALARRAVSRMLVYRTFRVWDHEFKRGR